jgi:septum formation protein
VVCSSLSLPGLVLASASPRRVQLLQSIGIVPAHIVGADLDETPHIGELPDKHAMRLAKEKALVIGQQNFELSATHLILAADTVVAVGRRILPKAETQEEAAFCLDLLSGRSHRVYTALALRCLDGSIRERLVESRVTFKRLSVEEKRAYLKSEEWSGKAGGYALQGRAAAFILKVVGSPSAVIGLPLYETAHLLKSAGIDVFASWSNPI